jgi:hypothetical protein
LARKTYDTKADYDAIYFQTAEIDEGLAAGP